MPNIQKILSLDITVEQFLNNCSAVELKELDMLIQSERYQRLINNNLLNNYGDNRETS